MPLNDPTRELAEDYTRRADAYARHWAPVIHPMAEPLLRALPIANATNILDVGAGTGALWPMIEQAAPRARVWGVDASEGMLRAGGHLLRGRACVMNAEQLGTRRSFFDVALLLFSLFHIPDPAAALREIHAALRRGGTLGLVVWGEDPGLPGRDIWTEELDRCGASADPRDPSVMRQSLMDTPAKLTALIEECGFAADRVWSERFTHQFTVERLLATQVHCGLPSRRLESLTAGARRECANRVRGRLQRYSSADLVYRVEVICGIAGVNEIPVRRTAAPA